MSLVETTAAPALSVLMVNKEMAPTKRLVALNSRNSQLLRLPHELLELVTAYFAAGEHLLKWMRIGHVCSLLRRILLGMHSLWGGAIYSWPSGLHRDELLKRAGPHALLSLHVHAFILDPRPHYVGALDACQFAMDHLRRAGSIHAVQRSFIEWFVKNDDEFLSLPRLEEVSLKDCRPAKLAICGESQSTRITPRLRHVSLHNVHWRFCPSALVTLSIHHTYNNSERIYSPIESLDLLREAKKLQELTLIDCLPHLPNDLVHTSTIFLPCLHKIHVEDRRTYAIQLWRVLSVPSEAEVSIHLRCNEVEDASYTGPECFRDCSLFKHHIVRRRAVSLGIISDLKGVGFTVYTLSPPDDDDTPFSARSAVRKSLTLMYKECFEDQEGAADLNRRQTAALRVVCDELELYSITHFRLLESFHEEDGNHWISLLGWFKHLEHITVKELNFPLRVALVTNSSLPAENRTLLPSLILLDLRQLTVENARFHSQAVGTSYPLSTAAFTNMMQSRLVRGQPLSTVTLKNLVVDGPGDEDVRELFLASLRSQFTNCNIVST